MAEYRGYLVGEDGHFVGCEQLICGDDVEAAEKARRLLDRHDVELWAGTRLVVRFGHKPA